MSIDRHVENREWAFSALDELKAFLNDPDFEGDSDEERVTIERKRRELRDGKYRVVFLGAFNVGKSTLINAFLGDQYLPTILEECTTKITHVHRGDALRLLLNLSSEAMEQEIEGLSDLLAAHGIRARVAYDADTREVSIKYENPNPRELLKTLNTLITVNAMDDYPQLRMLRKKFDEIFVEAPNDRLQEDIALVDSPGVHSISETNQKVAQEIIPHSHLVVCLMDSQNAGNEQNREFIETIVKQRRRKVFFVVNKSDQLNPDEIDPLGRRGPAKDLRKSLEGVVDQMELFFLSSLYALTASQLEQDRIELEDIDKDNKIKIPISRQRELTDGPDADKRVAAYLLEQSRYEAFKHRLLDYLYNENREGAIVESACLFIDGHAWKFSRPLEIKLEMARDVPRLEELRREREQVTVTIEKYRRQAQDVRAGFKAMAEGGRVDGNAHEGYEKVLEARFSKANIDADVRKPLHRWIDDDNNFGRARHDDYKSLTGEIEATMDSFLDGVKADVNRRIDAVESEIIARNPVILSELGNSPRKPVDARRPAVGSFEASLAGSYFGFAVAGAAVLGAAGAALLYSMDPSAFADAAWAATQQARTATGAGAGALLGVIGGLIVRGVSARAALRERLRAQLDGRIDQVMMKAGKSGGADVAALKEQLESELRQRRSEFDAAIQRAFDKEAAVHERELQAIVAEEEQLRLEQREVIERLEPKVARLNDISLQARSIADLNRAADKDAEMAAPALRSVAE